MNPINRYRATSGNRRARSRDRKVSRRDDLGRLSVAEVWVARVPTRVGDRDTPVLHRLNSAVARLSITSARKHHIAPFGGCCCCCCWGGGGAINWASLSNLGDAKRLFHTTSCHTGRFCSLYSRIWSDGRGEGVSSVKQWRSYLATVNHRMRPRNYWTW